MRVLIASDKFKGSATGPEVAAALTGGIRETAPGAVVEAAAVADGGEKARSSRHERRYDRDQPGNRRAHPCGLDRECTSIVLGVGGSACTDGVAGMLQALGARLWFGRSRCRSAPSRSPG